METVGDLTNRTSLTRGVELWPRIRSWWSKRLGRLAMVEELRCYAVREFQWRKSTRLRSTSTRGTTRNFRLQQNRWGASTAGCPRESYWRWQWSSRPDYATA